MDSQIFNYTFNITGNSATSVADITNNINSLNTQINNSVNVFNTWASKMAIFNQMAQGVQAFSDGLNNVLAPGAALNTSLADLSAISGETGEGLKTIEEYARDASKTFGGSAAQSVESYKLLLSQLSPEIAKTPAALKAMGDNVSILSKTMGGNGTAAAEVLITAMNQFGVSLDDPMEASRKMAEMMNVMAAAGKEGSAELPTIKLALEQLLKEQNINIKCRIFGEQNIGQYRVTADTVSGLLGQLKDHGGIRSFVRIENDEPILFCGVLFDKDKRPRQVFQTGMNIIDDTQLNTQNAADVKIKVKAISLMPNNKKIKVEVGDTDGETRTIHTYNKTEKELKAWAEQELERLKRDGLTGSFTTFGAQLVDKLDNIGIKIDGERKGVYQVQKSVIKYGTGGFRQEITIGARVA